MNYQTVVDWDPNVTYVWFLGTDNLPSSALALSGLAYEGKYIVSGSPATVAGQWVPGAKIYNLIDSTWYINIGSTSSPVWHLIPISTSGLTLPDAVTDSTTTTGTSFQITESALTSGNGIQVSGPSSGLLTGAKLINANLGTGTAGAGFATETTGVYVGVGLITATANSATTGNIERLNATALTTGNIIYLSGGASAMTTGRYLTANDGSVEVFGVGANGHIYSHQTTAPTIVVGTANGITAAAVTAGSSDTVGNITTTGTNNAGGATVLNITFNKTYTIAPKVVQISGTNASGAKAAATSLALPFVSTVSATGFSITIPSDASAGATPSFSYLVVA